MKKTVWAVQHVGYEDLGSFETTLARRGFEIRYFCSRLIDYRHVYAPDPDLLIVLGGPMGVYETDKHPWIAHELKMIEERIESETPLMGVCLGAQMIAKALGAKVYKGEQGLEVGWSKITVNEDGKKTPLRHLDGSKTFMMHWHGDTFDMPEGATLLASSGKYKKQAYRWGDHVLAMQCHPEVTENKLKLWYEGGKDDIEAAGLTVEHLKADAHAHNETLKKQAALFLDEWLDEQGL